MYDDYPTFWHKWLIIFSSYAVMFFILLVIISQVSQATGNAFKESFGVSTWLALSMFLAFFATLRQWLAAKTKNH